MVLLLGFAAGCLASAVATAAWGLASALACGVLVVVTVALERRARCGRNRRLGGRGCGSTAHA